LAVVVNLSSPYIRRMSTDEALGQTIKWVRTLRLKVKAESYPWLNAAAIEVNQVWNYANEVSARAARPYVGRPRWLSNYQLDKLTAAQTSG
jgi:putative transposase